MSNKEKEVEFVKSSRILPFKRGFRSNPDQKYSDNQLFLIKEANRAMRERRKALGLKNRSFYLTDDETLSVKGYIKSIRSK